VHCVLFCLNRSHWQVLSCRIIGMDGTDNSCQRVANTHLVSLVISNHSTRVTQPKHLLSLESLK
jgi:hypothetical protein